MGHLSGKGRTEIEREISYCFIAKKGGQRRELSPLEQDRQVPPDKHLCMAWAPH